jgi:hypothetical protein
MNFGILGAVSRVKMLVAMRGVRAGGLIGAADFGNNVVKVTLARIPNHHALAYAMSRHHPADELP